MYLQWEYDEDAQELIHDRDWEPESMSPILAGEGIDFERQQLEYLRTPDRHIIGPEDELDPTIYDEQLTADLTGAATAFEQKLEAFLSGELGETPLLIHQAPLQGQVGAYPVQGYVDLLHLAETPRGINAIVCEVKSTASQKVHHRYQATCYEILLEQLFESFDLDADTFDIDTAVVTPENDLSEGLNDVETFPTAAYRAKLELKLRAGGSFDQTILDTHVEQTYNRIAQRCSGCAYEPLCVTRGVESQGLELLGLQAGTQEALARLGIRTLEDMAMLFDQPGEDALHWDYTPLEPRDPDLVRRVRQEAEVSNLQLRSQVAYRFLVEIDDDYGNEEYPDLFAYQLQGAGNNLPADSHDAETIDWLSDRNAFYPSEGIIRTYLYVQEDYAQDRVTAIAAVVENTRTGNSELVVELPNEVPQTPTEKDAEENRLLQVFFEAFGQAVQTVAPNWETESIDAELGEDCSLDSDDCFIHLYLFSDAHRSALMEAIRRHPGAKWAKPLRTLLGLRGGIDQEMVSIIQNDFRQRWALRFPGLGLVQSTLQFYADDWFDWTITTDEGELLPLHEWFGPDLFDGGVSYDEADGYPRLSHRWTNKIWTPTDEKLARNIYPVTNRDVDTIPPAYIWGIYDRLDPENAGDSDLEKYYYREGSDGERLSPTDLAALAERFAKAVRHIEQGISAKDRYTEKQPIPLSEVTTLSFEARTIDEACIEYQQLEYQTTRTELRGYYGQPIEERLDTGGSVAFECTSVDGNRITGQLLDSSLERVAGSTPLPADRDPLAISGSDFMVMTPLDESQDRVEDVYRDNPTYIEKSPTVIIDSIDEEAGTISIEAPFRNGWPSGFEEYTVRHKGWDTEPTDSPFTIHVAPGDRFVLDPMADKITQARAYEALENAVDAPVRRWLRQLYEHERESIPVTGWDEDAIAAYLEQMAETPDLSAPNEEQEGFVSDAHHGIVSLQGPPGTGKTKYTLAPAINSRLHAAGTTGDGLLGIVSAVSHSAVDEALEAVLELTDTVPPADAKDISFIRICSGSTTGFDHDRVENIYYNEAEKDTFNSLWEEYLAPDADSRALFFAPPVSIRSFLNNLVRNVEAIDASNIAEWMQTGEAARFDLVVVDEASMMDLPLAMLVGSFLGEDGQFLLVGDHRQMQPIQQHPWEEEDREPIEVHVPFLSALDFLRYLRGEDVTIEYLADEQPEFADPEQALPVHRLRNTYRLPPESATMHTDLFYEQDGINLKSAGPEHPIPSFDGPLGEAIGTDDRITLLVHSEAQSQKSNPIEQAVIAELFGTTGHGSVDDDLTTGVVVPFRAQRRDLTEVLPQSVHIDTVERFQGGERDIMVLSMTASDRGYINQISEFLLDQNRFNVGASRMKRRLVIVASAAIFEESSNEIDTFEQHQAWVHLYQKLGGLDDDYEEYDLEEVVSEETWNRFLGSADGAENVSLQIYSGYPF